LRLDTVWMLVHNVNMDSYFEDMFMRRWDGKGDRPKEREKLRHKREILAGALKLFARRGFHAVSMQEIAAQTEFATGTLYKFFASKEALYGELMLSCGRDMLGMLLPILDDEADEASRLSRFIAVHQRIVDEHRDAIRLYLAETNRLAMVLAPSVEKAIEQMRIHVLRRLAGVIAGGVRRGHFRDVEPRVAAMGLSAMLESLVFSVITYPKQVSLRRGLAEIERFSSTASARRRRGDDEAKGHDMGHCVLMGAAGGVAQFDAEAVRRQHVEVYTAEIDRKTSEALAVGALGLDDCVQVALENNLEVRAAELDRRIARLQRDISFSTFLPTVSLGYTFTRWDRSR